MNLNEFEGLRRVVLGRKDNLVGRATHEEK
jgi:hypothetical protein